MPILQLLTPLQQDDFDASPKLTASQRERFFAMDGTIEAYVNNMREVTNQVGFLIQLAYFRASGKFFPNNSFRFNDIKFACKIIGIDHNILLKDFSEYKRKAHLIHKNYILNYSGWQKFTHNNYKMLQQELEIHAKKQVHTKSLLPIAVKFLINCKIELTTYYVLSELISNAYNKVENKLVVIVKEHLTENQKLVLDDLIWIDDKRSKSYKYSALSKIKQLSYSTKVKDIQESIKNYKLLRAFYNKLKSVQNKLDLPESATHYYSEWIIKSKLFQVKQFKDRSKAYLYLIGHIKNQYFKQTELYVEMLLKLISNANNSMERKLEKHYSFHLKEHRKAVETLVKLHQNSEEGYRDILNILENAEKTFEARNNEVCIIVLKQLNESFRGESDILKLANKNLFNQELKNKLLGSMGASLQKKLNPIVRELDFEAKGSGVKVLHAIQQKIILNNAKKNVLIDKGILFGNIFKSIKSGGLSIHYSYNYLPIDEYFIKKGKWEKESKEILKLNGLSHFTTCHEILSSFKNKMSQDYEKINHGYQQDNNKYLSFSKSGKLIIATPKSKDNIRKNKLAPVFANEGLVPIPYVLEKINDATGFVKCFRHHAIKKVIMRPCPETIFPGILSKGCNHGTIRMANISKGINSSALNNTINWFFSLENIQAANNTILDYMNKLSLPKVYKLHGNLNHTSSDGQKFNVGVNSILANYSFKYFGQSQGISVCTFIDDKQVMFYDTVISLRDREAAFVIDGLVNNNIVKSYIHSSDADGYSEAIFAVMHFLGISFAPRIKNVGSQRLYCLNSKRKYQKKDYSVKPNQKINLKLIEDNWDDILRLVATIKSKAVTASQIFKRLNSYSKESPLYRALKEFGRIIKTLFILTYINDVTLRKKIEKQLNKIELFHKFAKAVFFANSQEFRTGFPTEQRIIVVCKNFIQNCIVLWNYLFLSQILVNKNEEERKLLLKTIKESSVISWQHINLHGIYDFTAANAPAFNIVFDLDKIRQFKIA